MQHFSVFSQNFRKAIPPTGKQFDAFLESVFSQTALTEWGLPFGSFGRFLFCQYLVKVKSPILWIYSSDDKEPYPPSWSSLGFNLEDLYFVKSKVPLKDLKPVFLERTFSYVILDCPEKITQKDLAFLSRASKKNQQSIYLIRPFYLSNKLGNVFSRHRFNIFFDFKRKRIKIQTLKGTTKDLLIFL